MRQIPDDNLAYPCLLTIGQGFGSGFFLNTHDAVFLVSARHVMFDALPFGALGPGAQPKSNVLQVSAYGRDLKAEAAVAIDLLTLLATGDCRYHSTQDVVALRLGTAVNGRVHTVPGVTLTISDPNQSIVGVPTSQVLKLENVLVSNDVFIFGYPNSLGLPGQPPLHDRSRPLLRKGIVAGLNRTSRSIILDCPVYQGNSGGLVLEERSNGPQRFFNAIGVVSSFVPFVEVFESLHFGTRNTSIENSGYSLIVPMDFVIELIEAVP